MNYLYLVNFIFRAVSHALKEDLVVLQPPDP